MIKKIAALSAAVFFVPILLAAVSQFTAVISLPTISSMQSLGAASAFYPNVIVQEYHSGTGYGGGIFTWDPASTVTANGGTVFTASGVTTGRWLRQNSGQSISVENFGAYNNGTNGTTTRQATQAANDYVAASGTPTAKIEMHGAEYLFDTTGVVKTSSGNCPKFEGAGILSTTVRFSPASEQAAFTFIGGSGQLCGGGVRGLTITGNSNTVGCEWRGQDGSYCDIGFVTGKMPFLWCNCYSGAFSEDDIGTVYEGNTSGVTTPIGEMRVNNSGDASFRGSGVGDKTVVSVTAPLSTAMLIHDANAKWYGGNFGGIYTANASGSIGTVNLIQNLSSNVPVIISGHMDVEGDAADPINFADPLQGVINYGGTIGINGMNIATAGFNVSKVVFFKTHDIGISGVPTVHDASQLQGAQTFTASSGLTIQALISNDAMSFYVLIHNADNSYYYTAIVQTSGEVSAGGACAAQIISPKLIADTHTYGSPTADCASQKVSFSNAGWPTATFTVNYTAHAQ